MDEDYVINLYDLKGTFVKQLKSGKAKAGEITRWKLMVETWPKACI